MFSKGVRENSLGITLNEDTRREVKNILRGLKSKVYLKFFVPENLEECLYCKEEEEILKIISELAPLGKIVVEKYPSSAPLVKEYSINMFPALLIHSEQKSYGIRYFGIPAGYEFGALIEDILDVSRGKVNVEEEVLDIIKQVDRPAQIKVFVTPTCPYCPLAARAAHKFAIINEDITGDVIEALEFPEEANRYSVLAVPKVIINDSVEFEGALPEKLFALAVLESIGKKIPGMDFKEMYNQLRSLSKC